MAAHTVAATAHGKHAVTLTQDVEDTVTFTGGVRRVRVKNTHVSAPIYVRANQAVTTAITAGADDTRLVAAGETREIKLHNNGLGVKGTVVRLISNGAATFSIEKL